MWLTPLLLYEPMNIFRTEISRIVSRKVKKNNERSLREWSGGLAFCDRSQFLDKQNIIFKELYVKVMQFFLNCFREVNRHN